MNGNLEAVLYDCKHIGSIAQEIKDRIGMLRVIASEQNHRNVKEAYPNIGNVEEYIRRREAVKEIQALRACFSELADEMAVFPREAVFPDAADLYDEFRKEAKKMTPTPTEQRPQGCFRFHDGHCGRAIKEINLPNGETIYYAKCDPYCEYFIPKTDKQ